MAQINIKPERLLADLNALRAIGACGTGVVRPAFSDTDIAARRWLTQRMTDAGLTPVIDPVGNVFGLPRGDGKAMLLGSHSDTQPEGGWLDGAYGVIAALEVARASIEASGPPVAVVSFQDEEGRFGSLVGSNVWSGGMSLASADTLRDTAGVSFAAARQKISGICQGDFVDPGQFTGFIEAHIEQGIVLDRAHQAIGVVDSIVGIRSETYRFRGQQNHAGTTPMHLRKDAFQGLVSFTSAINQALAEVVTPATVWTIGHVALHPNAASIVPGQVIFEMQWRDAEDARLDQMRDIMHAAAAQVAETHGLLVQRSDYETISPTIIAPHLFKRIGDAAQALAASQWRHMPSGALHDAANVSRILPVAMLFVPSIGGISHDFAEDTATEHLVLGAQVLAASVCD